MKKLLAGLAVALFATSGWSSTLTGGQTTSKVTYETFVCTVRTVTPFTPYDGTEFTKTVFTEFARTASTFGTPTITTV